MDNAEFNFRLRNRLTPYRLCRDPQCPHDFAYRFDGSKTDHYHYVGELPPPEQIERVRPFSGPFDTTLPSDVEPTDG